VVSSPLLKPSRKYRVVQWATGSMGRTALRRVIDHPDLELVGVYVYDSRKVGVDAGEIARRPARSCVTRRRSAAFGRLPCRSRYATSSKLACGARSSTA